MPKLLYKCLTKATNKEIGNPRHSHNWVTSKRAQFKIYEDHISCGSWTFTLNQITNPIVFNSKQMFMSVQVLQFDFNGETYQFGFNPWAKPLEYLPFSYKTENIKIKHSLFSIVVRVFVLVYLIYYIWQYYLN